MPLGLRCPACQQAMRVPDHAQGRRVECPFCNHEFRFTGQKNLLLGRVPEKGSKAIPLAAAIAVPLASAAAVASIARPARAEVIELNELPGARPPERDVAIPEVVGETQPRELPEGEDDDFRPVTFPEDAVVEEAVAEEIEEAVEADLADEEPAEAELADDDVAEAELAEDEEVALAEPAEADFADIAETALVEAEELVELVEEAQFAEAVEADFAEAAEEAEEDIAEAEIADEHDPLMAAALAEMTASEPEEEILEVAEAEPEPAVAEIAAVAAMPAASAPTAQEEDAAFAEAMAVLSAETPAEPADDASLEEAEALLADEAEIAEAEEAELFVEVSDPAAPAAPAAPVEATLLAASPLAVEEDVVEAEEADLAEAIFESEPTPAASSVPTLLAFEDMPAAVGKEAETEEEIAVAEEEEEEAPKPKRAAPAPVAEDEVDLNEIFGATEIDEDSSKTPTPGAVFDDEATETMEPIEADQLFEDASAETENVAPKKSKGKDNETGKKKGWKLW
ncbi:MAG: hypothetical protein K2X38_05145 [Gemmataceae bacterium]|nr:hypothetical protein [Gemmataceae bacterium]